MVPAALRSLKRSSRVILGWLLTILMIIETPRGEILHGAPVRGRLTVILCFFHLRIITPTVAIFNLRWWRVQTQRPLRVPKTVLLGLLMLSVRLQIVSIYRQFIRNSLQNTSMIAKAFWISATHTNTNSRRRLLRSYKALVYCWRRTSRPRPRLLTLPAQGGVASGVREDGSAVSAEVYELG